MVGITTVKSFVLVLRGGFGRQGIGKLESEAREAKLGLWLDRDPGLGFSSVVTEGLHGKLDIRERTERRSWLHHNMWGSRCSERLGSLLRIWILQPL